MLAFSRKHLHASAESMCRRRGATNSISFRFSGLLLKARRANGRYAHFRGILFHRAQDKVIQIA
jgi:hypothetical protein